MTERRDESTGSEPHGADEPADPLARVFPGEDHEDVPDVDGVDARRQRLLPPFGDPDRESW